MAAISVDRVKVLTAAASLLFLAFAVTRAARVPLTYDEAASFIRYIDSSVPSTFETNALSLFNFEVATNHFVNTLLTKICWTIGGGGALVLRLPNLIAYVMFMAFSFLILRTRTDPWIAVAGFALLNLNPYVVEFFALSRGYGLSLGLLMGAVFFLLRFDAARALAFTCAAVMANFALLDVFVSMLAVIFIAGLVLGPADRQPPRPTRFRRQSLWLPILAAIFAALVLAQETELSGTLYSRVAVTLVGVSGGELDRVAVVETDLRGRDRRLTRDAGAASWHTNPGAHVRGIRVELPAAAAARLQGIELIAGNRVLSSGAQLTGWDSRDEGATRRFGAGPSLALPRSRLPAFRPVMNWAGDAHYAATLARATLYALLALAAFAALLKIAGWIVVRRALLGADLWHMLERGALWMAALAGVPLYLLKRHGELYFGGVAGLVPDTFYSLINRSFHGATYHANQTPLAFALIIATVAAFGLVLYVSWRRGRTARALPALCLIGLIVLSSLCEVVQHLLFQTLYLMDRTALFYVPLYILFVVFLCQAIADIAPAGRTAVRSILAITVALCALHFISTATTTTAIEWPTDASTKAMMADLRAVTRERPPDSHVVLGIEPIFAPVAVYYVRRTAGAIVDVVPASAPGREFFYGERYAPAGMREIRRYPATGTVLASSR